MSGSSKINGDVQAVQPRPSLLMGQKIEKGKKMNIDEKV
jgi:hypothetical protein